MRSLSGPLQPGCGCIRVSGSNDQLSRWIERRALRMTVSAASK